MPGKNLIVGNPSIAIDSISFAVASHLAMTMFGLLFNNSPTLSYFGKSYYTINKDKVTWQ